MEIRGRMGLDTERTGRGSTRESPSTTITGAKYYLSLVAAGARAKHGEVGNRS